MIPYHVIAANVEHGNAVFGVLGGHPLDGLDDDFLASWLALPRASSRISCTSRDAMAQPSSSLGCGFLLGVLYAHAGRFCEEFGRFCLRLLEFLRLGLIGGESGLEGVLVALQTLAVLKLLVVSLEVALGVLELLLEALNLGCGTYFFAVLFLGLRNFSLAWRNFFSLMFSPFCSASLMMEAALPFSMPLRMA